MLGNLHPTELILILLIVLLLFGGKKIPEIAKSLAQGVREFRKAGRDAEKKDADESKPSSSENRK